MGPQALKNRFGGGYSLIIKVKSGAENLDGPSDQSRERALVAFVQKAFAGTTVKEQHQGMVHFELGRSVKLGEVAENPVFSEGRGDSVTLQLEGIEDVELDAELIELPARVASSSQPDQRLAFS